MLTSRRESLDEQTRHDAAPTRGWPLILESHWRAHEWSRAGRELVVCAGNRSMATIGINESRARLDTLYNTCIETIQSQKHTQIKYK